jgi:hydrogenase maturation protease
MNDDHAASAALLIGIGNEFRDDDALGILVAREIRRRSPAGCAVREESGEGTALMEAWSGAKNVIIVDAISSGDVPGTIHRLDASRMTIPRQFFSYSSHAFGVAEAIAMAKQLHTLPGHLLLYGIEGKEFSSGVGLTDPVVRSIPVLISMVEQDLQAFHCA